MMDVSNVVRVLLEKAANCDGYAAQAEITSRQAAAAAESHERDAALNHRYAAEFRAAAEQLQPGCVADWQRRQEEAARVGLLQSFTSTASIDRILTTN